MEEIMRLSKVLKSVFIGLVLVMLCCVGLVACAPNTPPVYPDPVATRIITFNDNGGEGTMPAQKVESGVLSAFSENTYTKEGHIFEGWAISAYGKAEYEDGGSYKIDMDVTLYAVWTLTMYNITFNANGGSGTMPERNAGYDVPTFLGWNAFTMEGYLFTGWALTATGEVVVEDAERYRTKKDVMLYAIWTQSMYDITFDPSHGEGAMPDQNVGSGVPNTLSANTFVKEGYDFAGWALTWYGDVAHADGAKYSTTGDVTLYAVWEVAILDIKFDFNDGEGTMATQEVEYGKYITLSDNTFEKGGYVFTGWSLTDDGKVIYEDGARCSTTKDVTLYAVWEVTAEQGQLKYSYGVNGATVTGLVDAHADATSVDIPAEVTFEGKVYNVTTIGYKAFYNCDLLKSIIIPNGVTSIENYAFFQCTSLTSIKIPNTVERIGASVFTSCINLISITITDSVTSIGDYAFSYCESLTSITIPNKLTTISSKTFIMCESLESITIPNSVTSIGSEAFRGCTGLTEITIPDSVTSIGSNVFSGCIKLESINVDSGNPIYSSVDGVLFSKDQTVLIKYPVGNVAASYTILSSVKRIDWYAFSYCTNLTSVTIPNNVTSIAGFAFQDCTNLANIYMIRESSEGMTLGNYWNDINGEEAGGLIETTWSYKV